MKLKTERLYFKKFDISHTKGLFEMDNDPAVLEFINGGEGIAWEGFEERFVKSFERHEEWWKSPSLLRIRNT